VAAAATEDGIVVAGGFLADGTSWHVDLYLSEQGRWRRLPDRR